MLLEGRHYTKKTLHEKQRCRFEGVVRENPAETKEGWRLSRQGAENSIG
jgi:hypothetical protein